MNSNTGKKLIRKAAIVGGKSLLSTFDRYKYRGQFRREVSKSIISLSEKKMALVFLDHLQVADYDIAKAQLMFAEHCIELLPCDAPIQYWHGIPEFACGLSWRHKGQLVRVAIFSPVQRELYYFERGKKAKRNNINLELSKQLTVANTIVHVVKGNDGYAYRGANVVLERLDQKGAQWTFSEGVLRSTILLLNGNISAVIVLGMAESHRRLLHFVMESVGGVLGTALLGEDLGGEQGEKKIIVLCHPSILDELTRSWGLTFQMLNEEK